MTFIKSFDRSVAIAFGFIIVLLAAGSLYSTNFLSPTYLLQQLQVATFLGLAASGAMVVILLGHIDLSIPWIVTVGGMMSTAAAGWWDPALAIPFGLLAGLAFGVFNGIGVAFLRIPSMIFTLGVNTVAQGLMVLHTGGFAPQDHATDLIPGDAGKRLSVEMEDDFRAIVLDAVEVSIVHAASAREERWAHRAARTLPRPTRAGPPPRARMTCDGSGCAEVHAEPDERATSGRATSSACASSPVKLRLRLPATRFSG